MNNIKLNSICKKINKGTIVFELTFVFLLFSTLFFSFRTFVEGAIITKWYAFCVGGFFCGLFSLLLTRRPKIVVDGITVLVCSFVGYLLMRIFLSGLTPLGISVLSLVGVVILYFSFRSIPTERRFTLNIIISFVCVIEAMYGLMQYVGILYTDMSLGIVGSFDNSAGFAACLSTGFPFCLTTIKKRGWSRYLGVVSVIIISLSVILSDSRAGILAISLVSGVYVWCRCGTVFEANRIYTYVLIGMLVVLFGGLFFIRENSAIGRMLIWQNTGKMIFDKPLLGHGSGAFIREYMMYQSEFFLKNPNNSYSLLADNIFHPFNEYLLLIVENGVIGFLFILLLFLVLIRSYKQITIPLLCLISIGVFACFSYPMRYPFVVVVLLYSLTSFKTSWARIYYIPTAGKITIFVFLGIFCFSLIQDIRFENCWSNLVQHSRFGEKKRILKDYATLYSTWNGNPLFLYNYGAVLSTKEEYEGSNEIMNQCNKYLNNYNVEMKMADNYYHLRKWSEAEKHYTSARNMIPNRFLPLYKLMLLYIATENKKRAFAMAVTIRNKQVKIPSDIVTFIRNEADKCIITFSDTVAISAL